MINPPATIPPMFCMVMIVGGCCQAFLQGRLAKADEVLSVARREIKERDRVIARYDIHCECPYKLYEEPHWITDCKGWRDIHCECPYKLYEEPHWITW
jgi:hypothetical protein